MTALRAAALAAVFVLGASAAGSGDYAPTILSVTIDDGRHFEIATTSPEVCQTAVVALYRRWWLYDEGEVVGASCRPGDLFGDRSRCIKNYNCPPGVE